MPSDIDKKILALRLPVWRLGQVQAFLHCGKTRAYHEIAKCGLRFGKFGDGKEVKRDDFLKMYGTNYESEINNAHIEKEAEYKARFGEEITLKGANNGQ